jgi:hypothetical protein
VATTVASSTSVLASEGEVGADEFVGRLRLLRRRGDAAIVVGCCFRKICEGGEKLVVYVGSTAGAQPNSIKIIFN